MHPKDATTASPHVQPIALGMHFFTVFQSRASRSCEVRWSIDAASNSHDERKRAIEHRGKELILKRNARHEKIQLRAATLRVLNPTDLAQAAGGELQEAIGWKPEYKGPNATKTRLC